MFPAHDTTSLVGSISISYPLTRPFFYYAAYTIHCSFYIYIFYLLEFATRSFQRYTHTRALYVIKGQMRNWIGNFFPPFLSFLARADKSLGAFSSFFPLWTNAAVVRRNSFTNTDRIAVGCIYGGTEAPSAIGYIPESPANPPPAKLQQHFYS